MEQKKINKLLYLEHRNKMLEHYFDGEFRRED